MKIPNNIDKKKEMFIKDKIQISIMNNANKNINRKDIHQVEAEVGIGIRKERKEKDTEQKKDHIEKNTIEGIKIEVKIGNINDIAGKNLVVKKDLEAEIQRGIGGENQDPGINDIVGVKAQIDKYC